MDCAKKISGAFPGAPESASGDTYKTLESWKAHMNSHADAFKNKDSELGEFISGSPYSACWFCIHCCNC